ncbi:GNAT family N-acetyltransferase [Allomuricauda sp. d1]|uniref:GNAT family N-acetyltransferase n=1 Tax=Allomuricauda sp. d1 TaxID=3136725 RepID=UPI0031E189E8
MKPKLVKCRPDDVEMLAHLSRKTFKEAFEHDNNPEDFDSYMSIAFNSDKLSSELDNSESFFFFIYVADDVVGYYKVNIGNAQTDVQEDIALELERIYILKDFQGRQLGTWALHKVIGLAKKFKKEYVWLGVWEHNQHAIRFYERHGFEKFGEHPYYIGNDRQTDWLMRFNIKG